MCFTSEKSTKFSEQKCASYFREKISRSLTAVCKFFSSLDICINKFKKAKHIVKINIFIIINWS